MYVFLFSKRPYWLWGAPSLLSSWYQRLFLRVKTPACAADHSSLSNVADNTGVIPPFLHLNRAVLNKSLDRFYILPFTLSMGEGKTLLST